jgi:hypothetical protein
MQNIPFRFLGIPVGINPRRRATCLPILDSIKRTKLLEWSSSIYRRSSYTN